MNATLHIIQTSYPQTGESKMLNQNNQLNTLFQDEIEKKYSFLSILFDKMLHGKASQVEMAYLASLYTDHGIAVLRLSQHQLSKIPKIKELQEYLPNTEYSRRYGSENKAIFSYPLAGNLGTQGAVIISAYQGETCDITEFDSYLGPPHHHNGVVHITAVTKGSGFFIIAGEIEHEKYLVKILVRRGDIVLIPSNVIHTFFTSTNTFQVVSFTSQLIPTDSPDFLVLTPDAELKTRSFIDYADFLKKKHL